MKRLATAALAAVWVLAGLPSAAAERPSPAAEPERQALREELAELRAAARRGPLERRPALRLAAAELALGNEAAAAAQLESVAQRFDSVSALLELARLHGRRGEPQQATDCLLRALEIAPNSEDVLIARAKLALATRAPVPALRALEPLHRMHPTVAEYAYLLGVARLQLGDDTGAIEALERSLGIEPQRPLPLIAMGMAYENQKRFGKAKEVLLQGLQLVPEHAEALAVLAAAEEGLGELEEAESHARAALASAPDHAEALFVLGKVRMSQQRYAEARDALQRALAADPSSSKAHYQLSLAYARLNDPENSKKHVELYRQTRRAAEQRLVELRTKAGLDVGGMKQP